MRKKGGREVGKHSQYASDRGDQSPFVFKFCRHLGLILFPFPPSKAKSVVNVSMYIGPWFFFSFITRSYWRSKSKKI